MAIGEDLVLQLRKVLPIISDYFTDNIACTTGWADQSAGLQRLITSSANGIKVGNMIAVSGFTNNVTGAVEAVEGKVVTLVTEQKHDCTYRQELGDRNPIESVLVTFAGVQKRYKLLGVADWNKLYIEVEGEEPAVGAEFTLCEDYTLGWNGTFVVKQVISPKEFLVEQPNTELYKPSGEGLIKANIRIHRSSDIERLLDSYTQDQKNKDDKKLWLYVIPQDDSVSRDIHTENDSMYDGVESGNHFRLSEINRISLFLFIPSRFEIDGGGSKDLAKKLKAYIYKSIVGYIPKGAYANGRISPPTPIIPVSNDMYSYNTAFYIHEYQFEFTDHITNTGLSALGGVGDLVPSWSSVGLKSIEFDDRNESGEVVREKEVLLPK